MTPHVKAAEPSVALRNARHRRSRDRRHGGRRAADVRQRAVEGPERPPPQRRLGPARLRPWPDGRVQGRGEPVGRQQAHKSGSPFVGDRRLFLYTKFCKQKPRISARFLF